MMHWLEIHAKAARLAEMVFLVLTILVAYWLTEGRAAK